MARGFSFLFWGLILVFVDIGIHHFDIGLDALGFGLLALGSGRLSQYARSFHTARNLAWPLVVVSVLLYVSPPGVAPVLLALGSILTVVLIWFLLAAIIRFAADRSRPDLAGHAVIYRRFYVGIAIITFLLQQAALAEPESAAPFVTLAMIANLVILFFILRLLYVIRQDVALDCPSV